VLQGDGGGSYCASEQIVTIFSLAYCKHCGRVVNTQG
jgi:hypothetical protein